MLVRKAFIILILVVSYSLLTSSVWITESHASSEPVSSQAVNLSNPVPTEQGSVRGEVVGNTTIFRGIPYAAPPVGNLRWRASQFPEPRAEVLDAVAFSPICPQGSGSGCAPWWLGQDQRRPTFPASTNVSRKCRFSVRTASRRDGNSRRLASKCTPVGRRFASAQPALVRVPTSGCGRSCRSMMSS